MNQASKIFHKFSLFLSKPTNFSKNFRRNFVKDKKTAPTSNEEVFFKVPPFYLLKTSLALVGFGGVCFTGCGILFYENAINKVQNKINTRKEIKIRSQINEYWNSLTTFKKYIHVIIGANIFVFLLWRVPALAFFNQKYFISFPKRGGMFSSLLLSTFSHHSFAHLAMNMIGLYSISNALERLLGAEQFLAFYLTSGFLSSYFLNNINILTRSIVPALGASAAILACVATICMAFPESEFAIIFFPFFTFKAKSLLTFIIAFDSIGFLMALARASFRFKIAHVSHLSGTLFGIWYFKYGHKYLWESQKDVINFWHQFRSKKP